MIIPYVNDKNGRYSDIYSKLLENRIVILDGPVDSDSASVIIAELLYLASENPEKDIQFYINTPGGNVVDGLAILDTMNHIPCDVATIAVGMAASMGSILLAGGAKGKRFALPNSEVMIHQPLGGAEGQASDILIHAKHLLQTKEKLINMMAGFTGKSVKILEKDMDRDNFLTAEEAKEYGLIDKVLEA